MKRNTLLIVMVAIFFLLLTSPGFSWQGRVAGRGDTNALSEDKSDYLIHQTSAHEVNQPTIPNLPAPNFELGVNQNDLVIQTDTLGINASFKAGEQKKVFSKLMHVRQTLDVVATSSAYVLYPSHGTCKFTLIIGMRPSSQEDLQWAATTYSDFGGPSAFLATTVPLTFTSTDLAPGDYFVEVVVKADSTCGSFINGASYLPIVDLREVIFHSARK